MPTSVAQKSTASIATATAGIAFSVLNAGCSVFGIRTEETPSYEVIKRDGKVEIRRYGETIVAKTRTKGSFKDSQDEAFRILAGYIFGKNETKQKIAMTAPVVQKPSSEKIAMTAPVTQTRAGDEWIMTFTMPAQYTLETLPKPLDPRVEFEVVPPTTVAAIRFSGRWSEARNAEQTRELKGWLEREQTWIASGSPKFAGYDPPWTLPFLRRNEILIDVTDAR